MMSWTPLNACKEHGRGVLTDANGTRIVGVWNNGRRAETGHPGDFVLTCIL